MNQKDVVFSIDFVKVASLVSQDYIIRIVLNYDFVCSIFFGSRKVAFKFCEPYVHVAASAVDLSVIVKKQGHVVVKALDFASLPWAFDFVCGKEIGFVSVVCNKAHVESSVMMAYACGPHSLAVGALVVGKCFLFGPFKFIIDIGGMFPVHKIVRAQDYASGHKVHCGADHVVCVVHPNHVGIGKVCWYDIG